MAGKYRRIKQTPLRPILSEVLPYELPLPFDNDGMYEYLLRIGFKKISLGKRTFRLSYSATSDSSMTREWISLLLGSASGIEPRDISYRLEDRRVIILRRDNDCWQNRLHAFSHPLKYLVRKNSGGSRELTYMHPLAMLDSAQFLFDHRELVQYYCQRSRYSLRHPHKLARLAYRRDTAFVHDKDDVATQAEQDGREYEHATSFFTYSRYNNIYRFYSSSEFLACERKYSILVKTDVTRCFDSLYTHSLSWVSNGWSASKRHTKMLRSTFGDQFDSLMQAINYRETSGIVVGPELSRIFAEIILQEVDVRLERDLVGEGLRHQIDYDLLRYVDDYFIFARDPDIANKIRKLLEKNLLFFKMHLNESKTELHPTPIQSEMSIVKRRIERDLRDLVSTEEFQGDLLRVAPFSAKNGIARLKESLSGTEISISDVANFYLFRLEQRARTACRSHLNSATGPASKQVKTTPDPGEMHARLEQFAAQAILLATFFYSAAPSASHAIKVSRLLVGLLDALRQGNSSPVDIRIFSRTARNNIVAAIRKWKTESQIELDSLILLDCLSYLDERLSEAELQELFIKNEPASLDELDAIQILTLLRHCANEDGLKDFRRILLETSRTIIDSHDDRRSTDSVLLTLNLLTCPFLRDEEKAAATGVSGDCVLCLRDSGISWQFDWGADTHYYDKLRRKSSIAVY